MSLTGSWQVKALIVRRMEDRSSLFGMCPSVFDKAVYGLTVK